MEVRNTGAQQKKTKPSLVHTPYSVSIRSRTNMMSSIECKIQFKAKALTDDILVLNTKPRPRVVNWNECSVNERGRYGSERRQ